MKININGITRDMTPEEEAEFVRIAAEMQTEYEATEADYQDALREMGVDV